MSKSVVLDVQNVIVTPSLTFVANEPTKLEVFKKEPKNGKISSNRSS